MRQIKIGKVILTDGGAWNAQTAYTKLTYVTYNGDGWWSAKDNVNSAPSKTNTNWIQATDVQPFIEVLKQATTDAETINTAIREAENLRKQAETARVTAEQARATEENTRKSNEQTRQQQEQQRQSAEATRNTHEQTRETQESQRQQADTQRQQNYDRQMASVTTATELAQQKASDAQAAAALAVDAAGHADEEAAKIQPALDAMDATFQSKESQRDAAVAVATALTPKVEEVGKKTERNTSVLGPYADRAPIVLTLEENGKAINRAGVKVNKPGWAICSFVGQKGDVYSFDPGVMDNDVCIFSEEIVKKEYRPIEYKYTYDAEGLPTKASATYNGAVHSYTFTYEKDAEGHVTSETITDDQTGEVLNALPYQYQSVIGTYHPLTILNASAELPLDHHCRLISHFQGEGTIRVTVSFNVASADMNLLVFRDGLIANLATQLGTIFQMISETNKALSLLETQVKSLDSAVTNIVHTAVDDSALPTLCGQPPILFGAGTPQEAIVPDNWKQFDPETGEGYNWNGEPSAIGQQYINTSASTGGRYIAVPSADGGLTWKNF